MRLDCVFPSGNEPKLAQMAQRLGTRELLMCYHLDDPSLGSRKEELAKLSSKDLSVLFAIYADSQADVQKAQRFTQHIVARGQVGIYEDSRVKYVIDYESGKRADFIHHRNAGLTQVFVQKGIETGKIFLVNLAQVLESDEPHVLFGRMLQNNTLYRKYKPSVVAVSGATEALGMRDWHDRKVLLTL